jgi:hypothetical protein
MKTALPNMCQQTQTDAGECNIDAGNDVATKVFHCPNASCTEAPDKSHMAEDPIRRRVNADTQL